MFYQNDFLEHNFIVFDEIIRVKNFNIILKALIDRYPEKIFFCSASGEYEIVENILE
jgi:predicted AAA+ superfamily ATPase